MSRQPSYWPIVAFDLSIALAWWLTFYVIPEPWSWGVLIGMHLAHPFCATRWAGPSRAWRGFAVGPGLVLGVYAGLLIHYVIGLLLDGFPEATWLALLLAMVLAVAIGLVALYSLIVTAYLHRRSLRR